MEYLSLEINRLLACVRQAAIEAVRASKPFALSYGVVTSVSPLKIAVDQKMELSSPQLLLTSSVRSYTVRLTAEGKTQACEMETGLKVGENVLLLRANGGQKFIVLDRLEALK